MYKFQIYKGTIGYYFRFISANNQILLRSEAYTSKQHCKNGITVIKQYGHDLNQYIKKTSSNGKYYFNIKSHNNEIIVTSEFFESITARDYAISTISKSVSTAQIIDLT